MVSKEHSQSGKSWRNECLPESSAPAESSAILLLRGNGLIAGDWPLTDQPVQNQRGHQQSSQPVNGSRRQQAPACGQCRNAIRNLQQYTDCENPAQSVELKRIGPAPLCQANETASQSATRTFRREPHFGEAGFRQRMIRQNSQRDSTRRESDSTATAAFVALVYVCAPDSGSKPLIPLTPALTPSAHEELSAAPAPR